MRCAYTVRKYKFYKKNKSIFYTLYKLYIKLYVAIFQRSFQLFWIEKEWKPTEAV